MIDLSFLTEEEQETILSVLKRDSELKKSEEQRVQKLHQSLSNREQLRYLTGDWFYETKQLRHQDRIHGSDIIMASMRHATQKPLTILELSQILPEESSFVASENKEVFVPPVLRGLLQENDTDRSQNRNPYVPESDIFKHIQSPTKQRKNPFNSELCARQALEEDQTPKQTEDALPSYDRSISYASDLREDASLAAQNASENRAVSTGSNDSFADTDGPEGRQTNSSAPRGILKLLSNSSSTDTSLSDLDQQNPISVDPSNDTWIDRKQVRFNSMVSEEWQKGKELGEHSLLDNDSSAPSQMKDNGLDNYDYNYDLESLGKTSAGTQGPARGDSQEDDVGWKNEVKLWGQEAGRHQVLGDVSEHWHSTRRSPAGSRRVSAEQDPGKLVHQRIESEEDCHSQAQAKEGPTRDDSHRQNLPGQSADVSVEARSDIRQSTQSVGSASSSNAVSPRLRQRLLGIFRRHKDKGAEVQSPQREEVKTQEEEARNAQILSLGAADRPESKEVRTLPLAALQNTTFKDSVATVAAESQQDVTEDKAVQVPEKMSNLRAFWETANTSPKILFSRKETNEEGISGASHGLPTFVESLNKMSPQKEDILSPQTQYKLLVDVSREDGTYRANPVLIYEETDDSLTVLESRENITPSSVAFDAQKKLDGSSSSPSEEMPAKISELRHFWEKETNGPRVITARVKEDRKVISPPPDHRTSIDDREKSKISKSLKVTDKGFVIQSPERTRVMNSGGAGEVEADPKPQRRPLSPGKSKNHDDDVRLSPSKTCHPRVLPTESSSPKRSRLDGSPLKTFSINIDPQNHWVEEHEEKPSPMPRQMTSPSRGARQPEDREVYCDGVKTQHTPSTSPKSKPASEKRVGSLTRLARSFIPQDYQHYLGPQEKEYVPPFYQDNSVVQQPENDLEDFVDNQKKDGNSGQETTPRARSLSRASSSSYDDSPNTVMAALKRLSTRMTASKSLEDLTSQPSEARTKYGSEELLNRSVDDVSSLSPFASFSKRLRASVSVPILQQDETDSDGTFDATLGRRRDTGSSTSNISLSSGMASMSSVSGSISSFFHADLGNVEVQGNIQFAINYIQKLGEFHVFVVHCRDLAVADTKKQRSDPYVKCYLLPDKTKLGKRKTAVIKKTLNPNYNEILRFKIFKELLRTHNLNVSVWHNDVFGRNSFLGEVDLDLSEWDFSNTQINEYALKARVPAQTPAAYLPRHVDGRGQMRVALRFLPQTSHSSRTSRMETGEVQIWVKDCKSLPSVRGVIIDPFVKCTVLPDTSRKSRQKTRVVKRTANPMFNHTMVYDGFRAEDLREACVEITVWDHDRLNSHFIGGLRLGLGTGKSYGVDVPWMDSTTAEAHLWQRMLQSDSEWVEDVLPLRMFLMAMTMLK